MSSSHRSSKKEPRFSLPEPERKSSDLHVRIEHQNTSAPPPKLKLVSVDIDDTEEVPVIHLMENHEPTIEANSIFQMFSSGLLSALGSTCCGSSLSQYGFIPVKNAKGRSEYRMKS